MSPREISPSSEESESSSMEDSETSRELDEATHEPGAHIEQTGDIQTAEVIEAHLTQLSDSQMAQEEQGSLGGKESSGSETYDPQKEFSGVTMTQGEVLQDDDANEESGNEGPYTKEEIYKKIDQSLQALEEERQKGVEDMMAIQAVKEENIEEEAKRLKDKLGSDDSRTPPPEEVSNELLDPPEAQIPLNIPLETTEEDIMVDPNQIRPMEDDEDDEE